MGFAETFKALSDPIRREILMILRDGSMSAGEIGSHFDMTMDCGDDDFLLDRNIEFFHAMRQAQIP